MPREEKVQLVDELSQALAECSVGILTDYRGLTTAEITDLRRRLRNSEIKYRVVKNTLARFAAEKVGKEELVGFFEGPVAIAFGYGDIVSPAKIIADYIKAERTTLAIKGGFAGDTIFTQADIENLASLPSREVLLGKILAGIQSPVYRLVNCLANPMRGLVGVLQARAQQLEGG